MKGINKKLISGSLILLITFNIFNILNFFYQFSMVRLLSIVDYGILATLFSILYIFSIFTESIQTIVTKYSTSEKDKGKLKNLLKRFLKKSFRVSFLIFVAYVILAIPMSIYLKIPYPLIALNGVMIFLAFTTPVTRGLMQGMKMFKSLGNNMIIEASLKLIFAISLVLIGWRVYGALTGAILGVFASLLISFPMLKSVLKAREKRAQTSHIYEYTAPVFVIMSTVLIFFSLDIIIAKFVFTPEVAGYYAISSVLAKIIFIGTQPISRAMFPLSAEEKTKGRKPSSNVFMNAFIILLFAIIVALIIFYIAPGLLFRVFTGKYIIQYSAILFNIAVAVCFLSLTNLILLYKLSLGKTRGYYLFLIFIIIQAFLLVYFSANLLQFSVALITASAIFLWGSIFLLKE